MRLPSCASPDPEQAAEVQCALEAGRPTPHLGALPLAALLELAAAASALEVRPPEAGLLRGVVASRRALAA